MSRKGVTAHGDPSRPLQFDRLGSRPWPPIRQHLNFPIETPHLGSIFIPRAAFWSENRLERIEVRLPSVEDGCFWYASFQQ
jgi:hypothetical protein